MGGAILALRSNSRTNNAFGTKFSGYLALLMWVQVDKKDSVDVSIFDDVITCKIEMVISLKSCVSVKSK